ncbi:hypothetical protein AB0F46_17310 [Streptomyces sp. NPDC026665]|uniref:hypothetical protein n=1 Tax=Streptomyces sp. NPDC026665 TaxID=3154798 RepID=UPI0033F355FB
MSMQDQFKDKAERMKQQGKKKTRPEGRHPEGRQDGRQDEASRRSPAGREDAMPASERAQHEAQDRFDQDYDA